MGNLPNYGHYDRDFNGPDTTHSPIDADADAQYAAGEILTETVPKFVTEFCDRHPEAVVWDTWHQLTRYFLIQSPAGVAARVAEFESRYSV